MAGQIDDVQCVTPAQALDQRREHATVHRPAVQQHQWRTAAKDLDMQRRC